MTFDLKTGIVSNRVKNSSDLCTEYTLLKVMGEEAAGLSYETERSFIWSIEFGEKKQNRNVVRLESK